MADKSVGELIAAQSVTPTDLFVLEQNGTAKKLTGQILLNWLTAAADGHGGIKSIQKVSTSGLTDTYRITLADTTTFDFVVTNGKGVENIKKTDTSGLVDTYTIYYTGGLTSTFTVTNGAKGDKGDNQYVWIKYASQKPTASSHSFGDVADNWIGVYSGESATAPMDWQQYTWFEIKGAKGDTGAAATLTSSKVEYQVSDSGTIIPSGAWSESVAVVPQGKYLWTRVVHQFNTGDPVTSYSVSRMGMDGAGSVSSVANVSPDSDGNVPLTADDVKALPTSGGNMTGAINMNGQALKGLNAPTANDQAANKGYTDKEITDRVIYGKGKNLLKNTAKSQTSNGVTFTVNDDGSIAVNGEHSANIVVWLNRNLYLQPGRYILSGGLSTTPIEIHYGDVYLRAYDTAREFTIETETVATVSVIALANVTANGTVYPMIRLASETDDTYEPYYKGLVELTDSGMELMWRNASPTSAFAEQNVVLDFSGYDFYGVLAAFNNAADATTRFFTTEVGKGLEINISSAWGALSGRKVTVSNNGLTFWKGITTGGSENNTFAIPLCIYVFKGESA